MKDLLIVYPKEFNSYSKFERKMDKVIERLDDLNLCYLEDPNQHIKKYSYSCKKKLETSKVSEVNSPDFDYVVIFDDGEEYNNYVNYFTEVGVKLRVINIAITRVINIKTEKNYENKKNSKNYEYIGRGSYWGNPHSMYEKGESREEVIRKYKYDFDYDKFINKEKKNVYKLNGKRLGCFCKPEACHGDILADYLNGWDDGK